jgi:hypothetical protein
VITATASHGSGPRERIGTDTDEGDHCREKPGECYVYDAFHDWRVPYGIEDVTLILQSKRSELSEGRMGH